MKDTILEVKDLSVTFTQYDRGFSRRTLHAVEKMDLSVRAGEIVAVVGSSGSGKSLLAHAIMGILPYNSAMDGEIRFLGTPLTAERVKKLRGHEIVFVPQSVSYLDPLMKIGDQIRNGKKDHSVKEKCLSVLKRYGLAPDIREKYPFQLSGGMTRRVLISTAVMETPKLVIADEPTPGLHMEAATRVMGHFREMADDGAGVLLITHDLELALLTADRVVVLYGGRVIEETDAAAFQNEENLKHPYTKALLSAIPVPDPDFKMERIPLKGELTSPINPEPGCRFAKRCPYATEGCTSNEMTLKEMEPGHFVSCRMVQEQG